MTGRRYTGLLGAQDILLLDLILVPQVCSLCENTACSICENA